MRLAGVWLTAIAATSLVAVLMMTGCGEAEAPPSTPEPTPTPSPDATITAEPAIAIDSPGIDETVSVPVKVRGSASVFEGTVLVVVKDSQGNDLCQVIAQASEGAPGRGDYEVDIAFPPPSSPMEGRVDAYSESPKDGSVENLESVAVTISAEKPNIVIDSPLCNEEVTSPFTVEGTASVFEGALVIVVKDLSGNELARANVLASSGVERGDFSQEITFTPLDTPQRGTVEAFTIDADDGSITDLFSVPVILAP